MSKEPLKLDYATALADLRELSAARPDYVYDALDQGESTCAYFIDDQPSCIVGHVLAKHGMTADDLLGLNVLNVRALTEQRVISPEPHARHLLAEAQRAQDRREPWGVAVQYAVRWVEERWDRIQQEQGS